MMFRRSRLLLLLLAENQNRSISLFDYSNTQLSVLRFNELLFANRAFCSISADTDKQAFTVSYLINSCGLSPDSAKSVSKNVLLSNTNTPDSILTLLRDHGLTHHHISQVVRKTPRLLKLDAAKTVLPKLQFLTSIGFSSDDLSTLMSKNPGFLCRSLKQFLFPLYDIVKCSLSDQDVAKAFNRLPLKTLYNLNNLNANLSALREIGMPPSTISLFLKSRIEALSGDTENFKKAVKEVVEMGFHPVQFTFVGAVNAKIVLSKSSWKGKLDAYEKWGISEDEVLSAFRKHPQCMMLSEESIHNKMDFLVRKMGWQPVDVLKQPIVMCYSLEERIMPRCLTMKLLLSKSLIKSEISLCSFLKPSDERFLVKYVIKHREEVPTLLEVFEGRMNAGELGFGFDDKCVASLIQHSRE